MFQINDRLRNMKWKCWIDIYNFFLSKQQTEPLNRWFVWILDFSDSERWERVIIQLIKPRPTRAPGRWKPRCCLWSLSLFMDPSWRTDWARTVVSPLFLPHLTGPGLAWENVNHKCSWSTIVGHRAVMLSSSLELGWLCSVYTVYT